MNAKTRTAKAAKKVLKPGSKRFNYAKKAAVTVRLISWSPRDSSYSEWVERTEPYTWSEYRHLKYEPKISVVVPVFNPPAKYFLSMIYSIVNQTYSNWELVLVNASTKAKCRRQTEAAKLIDERIKVVNLSSNKGIGQNTNAGLEKAEGEHIGLLDHDDLLAPAALYEVVLALQTARPDSIIYSDEDKVAADGEERFEPHFKPDWSPQLLRQLNYLNHFTVISKGLLNKVDGYQKGFDGAQDYDLFLRLVDQNPEIIHVPKILYHWRMAENSTARDFSAKKGILSAGVRAIEGHLERNHQSGTVTALKKQPGFYRIRYNYKSNQPVVLMIMPGPIARQQQRLLEALIKKLKKTKLKIDVYSQKPPEESDIRVPANVSINFIAAKNRREFIESVLNQTSSTVLVLIGAAVIPKHNGWLDDLSGIVEQVVEVGLVTPLITDTTSKSVLDAGFVRQAGEAKPLFKGHVVGKHTYFGNSDWVRNIDVLSGRCLAVRTSVLKSYMAKLETNGGKFTPESLCEHVRAQNLQIVLWPYTPFIYRGELKPKPSSTEYFSPSLSIAKEEFSIEKTINMPDSEEDK